MPQSNISEAVKGNRGFPKKLPYIISNELGYNLEWYLTGKGEKKAKQPASNQEMAEIKQYFALINTKIDLNQQLLMEKLEQIRDAISDIKIKEASVPTKVKHRQKH